MAAAIDIPEMDAWKVYRWHRTIVSPEGIGTLMAISDAGGQPWPARPKWLYGLHRPDTIVSPRADVKRMTTAPDVCRILDRLKSLRCTLMTRARHLVPRKLHKNNQTF